MIRIYEVKSSRPLETAGELKYAIDTIASDHPEARVKVFVTATGKVKRLRVVIEEVNPLDKPATC